MPQFSFEVAAHIVEDLAQDYGKWQNTECRQMHEGLTELDAVGKELVPRSRFWSRPVYSAYRFSGSLEYLRTIGALDGSVTNNPQTRIANYLTGPSNCQAARPGCAHPGRLQEQLPRAGPLQLRPRSSHLCGSVTTGFPTPKSSMPSTSTW